MVKIKKLVEHARLPQLGTEGAAAFDVEWCSASKDYPVNEVIPAGEVRRFHTGLAFEIPSDMAMLILPRSGLATRDKIRPANTPGLLDSDYRGELIVALENFGNSSYKVRSGDRIAQILFVPIVRPQFEIVAELTSTERGEGGFGHTGA